MASDLNKVRLGFKEIMEISKPRIVVLLVITAVTSMYAASKLVPDAPQLNNLTYLHIIIAGALASAGSSALNHYYDKDIDPKMTRTSTRPIPSGRMAASHVFIYGLTVSCISVIYGYFTLNPVSAFFIALGIFAYVIIYTVWLKRLNSSNIVIGGIAGSAATRCAAAVPRMVAGCGHAPLGVRPAGSPGHRTAAPGRA